MATTQRQLQGQYAEHVQSQVRLAADKTHDELYQIITSWLETFQPPYRLRHSFKVKLHPSLFTAALAELMLADPDALLVITRETSVTRLGLGQMIRLERDHENSDGRLIVLRPEKPLTKVETLGTLRIQHPTTNAVAALLPPERLVLVEVNCLYYPVEPVSDEDRAFTESYLVKEGLAGAVPDAPGGAKLLAGVIRFLLTPWQTSGYYLVQAMCNPAPVSEANPVPLTEYFHGLMDRASWDLETIAQKLPLPAAPRNSQTNKARKTSAHGVGRHPDHSPADWERWVQGWFQAEAAGQLKDDYIAEINAELRKAHKFEISRGNFNTWQTKLTRAQKVNRYDVDTCPDLTA